MYNFAFGFRNGLYRYYNRVIRKKVDGRKNKLIWEKLIDVNSKINRLQSTYYTKNNWKVWKDAIIKNHFSWLNLN